MLDPHSLRGRLTITYASALVAALIAFAALALAVLDTEQRSALDAQLATTGRAVLAIVVEREQRTIAMEPSDRAQFVSILGAKGNGAVLRPDGSVLVSSTLPPRAVREVATSARSPIFATRRIRGEAARIFATPVGSGGTIDGAVAIWHDAEAIAQLDRRVAVAFALAIPVLATIAIVIGAAIARRGLAPLERIATLASEIEGHDLSRRLALPQRKDELGRLAATFDRMLDRLQRAFDRQLRFTSDASHELRAPLSVIRAEADLALRKERSPGEYRRALETIAAEADALERLTQDLLAAARSEAVLDPPLAPVDLDDLATVTADRLAPLADARGVRIVVEAAGTGTIAGHADSLERAVVTVTHNAIKYAASRVSIATSRIDGSLELAIADDGPGFSQSALEHAFDRFWRDDAARTGEGTGLGLAIAQTIVTAAGGTITIANQPTRGAIVRMRFPAQPSS